MPVVHSAAPWSSAKLVLKSLGFELQFLVKNSKFIRELGEGKLVDRNGSPLCRVAEER